MQRVGWTDDVEVLRKRYVNGHSGLGLLGDADTVASGLAAIGAAGFDGVARLCQFHRNSDSFATRFCRGWNGWAFALRRCTPNETRAATSLRASAERERFGYEDRMQPQEPFIDDPDVPGTSPQTEIINDPDLPVTTPVDDVYEPMTEGPDIVD